MIEFELEINIYRSLGDVFSFIVRPENDFHWQYGTLMSAQTSKGEMEVGALFRSVCHFLGRRMENVYEVTEFEPNKKYGFRTRSNSMQSYTTYMFDGSKYGTRIKAHVQIEPGHEWKTINTATLKTVKKQYRENLALLKDILEASPTEKMFDDHWLVSSRRR